MPRNKRTKSPFVCHNFISRIIRCQISAFKFFVGDNYPVPIIPMRGYMWRELFEHGPAFAYKGNEVIWNWRKKEWLCIDCSGGFKTLDEIDRFWREYEELISTKDFVVEDF